MSNACSTFNGVYVPIERSDLGAAGSELRDVAVKPSREAGDDSTYGRLDSQSPYK